MKKFLIVGLGNIGPKYENTRHNIGFKILDEVATSQEISFTTEKLGDIAMFTFKGKKIILLKPSTFMNLSGKALKYWMQQENIALENVLVVTDDVHIDFGTIRVKAKGSAGGHNGVKSIIDELGTNEFNRLKIGVGHPNLEETTMLDYVLGDFTEPQDEFNKVISFSSDIITNILQGVITHGDTFNLV